MPHRLPLPKSLHPRTPSERDALPVRLGGEVALVVDFAPYVETRPNGTVVIRPAAAEHWLFFEGDAPSPAAEDGELPLHANFLAGVASIAARAWVGAARSSVCWEIVEQPPADEWMTSLRPMFRGKSK